MVFMKSSDNVSRTEYSESSQKTASILMDLFGELKSNHIRYVVLRNFENLPYEVDNDVDLLVEKKDVNKFEAKLKMAVDLHGLQLIKKVRRFRYVSFWYILPGVDDVLHIDVWTAIDVKGICWLDEKEIIDTRNSYSDIFVPQDVFLALMLLLKDVLQTGKFRDKYQNYILNIINIKRDECILRLTKLVGKSAALEILSLLEADDLGRLNSMAKRIRNIVLMRSFFKWPFKSLFGLVSFFYWHLVTFFRSYNGLFLVLVGPDGSGKSSVYSGISNELSGYFKPCLYYHGRFNIIPDLRDLCRGRFRAKKTDGPDFDFREDSGDKKTYGLFRSLLYVFYYLFDYLLGYFVVKKNNKYGGLIVFDRYFYDYMIQPAFSKVPNELLRVFTYLLPKPDMVVYLKCDPNVIHARKPELDIENIKKQQEVIEKIFCGDDSLVTLDTARDVDMVSAELKSKVDDKLLGRIRG